MSIYTKTGDKNLESGFISFSAGGLVWEVQSAQEE
ncbi:MAG: hypothetical protein UU14_C0010G0017 [Candidatus Roizmanbacteria bacterium GW2011_GWB1_40_7]|uniref:Uncharacterized protein n=2 Tax=Candidatus Roizmaniibacteriota TaxID=1752723 RepID=A0A0G0X9G3_9BACT|nr:MAG: hypothetical protein UU14_C0010G0017 [Candidatus Roizmanbacteria bacterium GW2011_GWB1_40_7]KKS21032.1 MAG: hypothetical protein UU78_C0045G0015 [Candidatus Roizmanbacteria bacterium GW2011_GWC2_41_7]